MNGWALKCVAFTVVAFIGFYLGYATACVMARSAEISRQEEVRWTRHNEQSQKQSEGGSDG